MKIENQNYSKLSIICKILPISHDQKRSKIIISSLIFPPKKNNAFLQMMSENHFGVKQQLVEVDVKKRKMKMI